MSVPLRPSTAAFHPLGFAVRLIPITRGGPVLAPDPIKASRPNRQLLGNGSPSMAAFVCIVTLAQLSMGPAARSGWRPDPMREMQSACEGHHGLVLLGAAGTRVSGEGS